MLKLFNKSKLLIVSLIVLVMIGCISWLLINHYISSNSKYHTLTFENNQTVKMYHRRNNVSSMIISMSKPTEKLINHNSKYHIKPSYVIALALYSSYYGNSPLYKKANNPFVIKGHYDGNMVLNTMFNKNGHEHSTSTSFAKYNTLKSGIHAYLNLVQNHKKLAHPNVNSIIRKYDLTRYDYVKD